MSLGIFFCPHTRQNNQQATLRIHYYILLTWLFFCISYLTSAQDYVLNVTRFGIEEGLSHRNVHFALQDHQGLMWFGTDYGLNRFDGYHFKWITKEKHGLQSTRIREALVDNDGFLWLLYGETKVFGDRSPDIVGIDIFDPITEEVQTFEDYFKDKIPFQSTDFHSFTKKANGDLVFLTKQMQLVAYSSAGKFTSVDLKNKYEVITNFHWSKNGYFWMAVVKSNVQLYIIAIDEAGEEIHSLPVELGYINLFSYQSLDSQNEKWIATRGLVKHKFLEVTPQGQYVQNQEEIQMGNFDLDFAHFGRIAGWKDAADFSWFFSNDGFILFDKQNNQYQRLNEQYPDLSYANHIFFAGQEKIWISTQFGIFLIDLKKNLFSKILNPENALLPVRGLALDKNNVLWIVEESMPNLWRASLGTNKKEILNVERANNPEAGERLPILDMFYALGMTYSGNIMYSPSRKTFIQFNPTDFDYDLQIIPDSNKYDASVWSLFEEKSGKVWLGTDNGFLYFFEEGNFNYFTLLDKPKYPLHIYQFIEGEDHIWVVTEFGLFILEKSSNRILERYWAGGEGKFKLPFDNLYHAYREDENSLWLGTAGNGLVHFNPQNGEYQQFTKSDGLSNNTIYAVYPDDFGNLWLTSDYGIMRFNKTSHQINTYLTKDGISHNEFNRISHHQSEDGTLFFGGLSGVTAFHPSDFQTDSLASNAPLVISNFQQFIGSENELSDKTKELLTNNKITLASKDPFFRLEFALLTYEEGDKNQYAYKIEGVDQNWYYQKENYIRVNRLQYGNYTLRIKGQAANGQWSQNELSIPLEIIKPFYLETWFLILSAFLIVVGIYSLFKLRTSQLKKQKKLLEDEVLRRTETIREQAEELKSLERLKSRFFANVSHELRTPLTLIMGPVNTLLKRNTENETDLKLLQYAKQNCRQLMKLINEILDLSKLEANKLEIVEEPVLFYNYLKDQTAQFHSFGTSERVHFEVDFKADKSMTILLDKNKFEKIVHNFLSNALKFTPPEGNVDLTVIELENKLRLIVTDTGRGIHPDDLPHIFDRFYQSKKETGLAEGGTGIGLSLCKELAQLLGGEIWAESELGKGSTFYFEFPKKVVSGEVTIVDSTTEVINPNMDFASTSASADLPNYSTNSEKTEHQLATGNQQPETILLVEDNKDLREYLKYLLSDYNVITAENGKIAIEKLSAEPPIPNSKKEQEQPTTNNQQPSTIYHRPDLIISDLMMPVMDGFEFLETIKADDRWRHIPVIMLTAKVNVKAKIKALRIGVDDYLNKPFEEEELKARIENLLRNYQERMVMATLKETNGANQKEDDKPAPIIAQVDSQWLEEVENIFAGILADTQFTMEWVASEAGLSLRQFTRRLKQLTGLTPNLYLREMRLQVAKDYLYQGKFATIKETSYAVGFSDTKYFSRLFQQRFGLQPSVYASSNVL